MTVASIDYNVSKWSNALLDAHKADEPSFAVHFHEAHWTINNSATSQFLYTQPISTILDDIRALRIPTDFIELFDKSDVRFFEGCLIVALYDHRIRTSKRDNANGAPEPQAGVEPHRVVLQPTAESLYADIKSLAEADALQGRPWTDEQALDFESRLLLATSQPLCLEPDVNVTRIANKLLRASTPNVPRSLKRKRGDGLDDPGEEDEFLRRTKTKLMQFMNPRVGRTFNPRLIEGRMNFNAVREYLESTHPPPPSMLGSGYQGRQSTPLAVNTGVAAAPSALSAVSSKGKGEAGKKEDRKPKITTLETVIRNKGRMNSKVEESPASASSNPTDEPKPRINLIVKPPQSAQTAAAQAKKDDQTPQQRVSTPAPAAQLAPGRVATPVQQIRSQTPVPPQGFPAGVHAIAAPHPVVPSPQTSGMTFQPGQLPDGFLRQPPAPKNSPAPGSPMAGKRPQTPLQAHAYANAMKTATVGSPVQQAGPSGQPARPPQQFNPALLAAQNPAAYAALQQRMALMNAGRGGMPAGAHNRFTNAMQMARPGAPGVVVLPPNLAVAPPGGADGQQAQQQQMQWAQMQAAMMARGAPQMTQAQYQQLQWQMATSGRGMPMAAMGRGQMHPQQMAMLQQLAAAGRGTHLQPGQQPKPPGTR